MASAEQTTKGVHRRPVFGLGRSGLQQAPDVSRELERPGVPHAITGAAAAVVEAPAITAVPTAEMWVSTHWPLDPKLREVTAEEVLTGANLVLLQVRDNRALGVLEDS